MLAALVTCAVLGQGLTQGLPLGVDPKVPALESSLLDHLNKARTAAKREAPLGMDEKLRAFARRYAELAAKGAPEARQIEQQIKAQGLAPYGYRVQFSAGDSAETIVKELKKDKGTWASVIGEFTRAGLGAFWVPAKPAYFQVVVLLAAERDPLDGVPGLSKEQTDPVMNGAAERIKASCYDPALKVSPNIRGELVFQLVIGESGAVSKASLLKGLSTDGGFDGCALGVARGLKFPTPYKGKAVTLNHPMRFMPPQGERNIGVLQPSQIQAAFAKAAPAMRRCYESRLKADKYLEGRYVIRVTVEGDGKTRDGKLDEDTIGDATLAACILEQVKVMRFAAPAGGGEVDVTYPLSFDSRGTKY